MAEKQLIGIWIKRECHILHYLLFVDGSFFFMKVSLINLTTLLSIIDDYCRASDQGVNLEKSSLFLSLNVQENARRRMELAMDVKGVLNPDKYLELPSM